MLKQEKNCSHEVTVVLFSRTFYNAKSMGESISFVTGSNNEYKYIYHQYTHCFPQMNFLRF